MARVRPGKAERAAARAAAAEARIVRSVGHNPKHDGYYCDPVPTKRRPIASGSVVRGGIIHTRDVRVSARVTAYHYTGCVTQSQHAQGARNGRDLVRLDLV